MKKIIKILFLTFLSLLAITTIFVAFIPTIISSDFGKNTLIKYIQDKTKLNVSIDKIDLSWLGDQKIEGVRLYDKNENILMSLNHMTLSQGFLGFSKNQLKDMSVDDFNAIVKLEDSSVVQLKNVSANVSVNSQEESMLFNLTGKTEENGLNGHFNLFGKALMNETDHINELNFDGTVENFPVRLIDEVTALFKPDLKDVLNQLFGKTLNLTISENIHASLQSSSWTIQSPNFTTAFKLDIVADKLTLISPSKIELKLTPQLFEKISPQTDLSLLQNIPTTVWVKTLEIPLNKNEYSLDALKNALVELEIECGKSLLETAKTKNKIQLSEMSGELFSAKANEYATFHIQAKGASEEKKPFYFKLQADLDKSELLEGNFFSLKHVIQQIETKDFPSVLLEGFFEKEYLSLIGPYFDVNLHKLENKKDSYQLQADSSNLEIEEFVFQFKDEMKIVSPCHITIKLDNDMAKNFSNNAVSLLKKDTSPIIKGIITDFDYFFSSSLLTKFDANFELTSQAEFQVQSLLEKVNVPYAKGSFFLNQNKQLALDLSLQLSTDQKKYFYDLFGKEAKFNVKSVATSYLQDFQLPSVNFEVFSDKTFGNMQLSYMQEKIELIAPTTIHSTFSKSLLSLFNLPMDAYEIVEPFPFQLSLTTNTPIDLQDLSSFELSGLLTVPSILLNTHNQEFNIKNLLCPLELSANNNKLKCNFSGELADNSKTDPSIFKGKYILKNWLTSSNFEHKIKLDIVQLPTHLLASSFNFKQLDQILGQAIDLGFYLHNNGSKPNLIDIDLQSELMQLDFSAEYDKSCKLHLTRPLQLNTEITPSKQRILENFFDFKMPFEVTTASTLELKINEFNQLSPLFYSTTLFPLDVHFVITPLDLTEGLPINCDFSIDNQFLKLFFDNHDTLFCAFQAQDFITPDQTFNKNLKFCIDAKMSKFAPASLFFLSSIYPKAKDYLTLFGNEMTGSLSSNIEQLNGHFFLNLTSSSHALISIDSQVNQGILTLNKPFHAKMLLTTKISEELKTHFKIFESIVESEKPIHLTIEKDRFSVNLLDILPSATGNGSLELGKIKMREIEIFNPLFTILLKETNHFEDTNNLLIWTTPQYFNFDHGVLELKRMDFLAMNRFYLASWGKINFINDKVNMILGITNRTLINMFNLKNLNDDSMLQIPFKGSISNPKLNKKSITAQLGNFFSEDQKFENKFVNSIIEFATRKKGRSVVPAPTTHPFPWDQDMDSM